MSEALDISEVLALTKAAVRSLEDQQPAGVFKILDSAAAEERRTHAYRNITRHLEQSTFASEPVKTDDGFSSELGARTHYASDVEQRGRSRIVELAEQAITEVDFYFDGEAQRLGTL